MRPTHSAFAASWVYGEVHILRDTVVQSSSKAAPLDLAAAKCRGLLFDEQGYPRDRPLFRRDCALNNASMSTRNGDGRFFSRLVNVHEGVDVANVSGGSVTLVTGQYEYYHYMQVRACFGRKRKGLKKRHSIMR